MKIREVEDKDFEQVNQLHDKLYPAEFHPEYTQKIGFTEKNFEAKLLTLVAEENNHLFEIYL